MSRKILIILLTMIPLTFFICTTACFDDDAGEEEELSEEEILTKQCQSYCETYIECVDNVTYNQCGENCLMWNSGNSKSACDIECSQKYKGECDKFFDCQLNDCPASGGVGPF